MTKRFPLGELVVPTAMLIFVVAYWRQAYGLSFEARLFPTALTLALLALIAAIFLKLFRQRLAEEPTDEAAAVEGEADTAPQPVFTLARIAVVLVPAILLCAWNFLGGIVFTALTTLAVAFALGERRLSLLILLPVGTALGLHLIFWVVLHARIPHGLAAGLFG
ncbi:tripartite tricarboxylate transporter TctB family protein [Afifella sp. IM 167]|uniref:tripartite tricarboxylate transporter TctB family protein n=1 Tax=Afifella sp. IM 167 TaxID=2033586 RepID=UPI001CC97C2E|nr:tripartite tricarboxylate transporter TctB family protein [Afifella sp. IM 167]